MGRVICHPSVNGHWRPAPGRCHRPAPPGARAGRRYCPSTGLMLPEADRSGPVGTVWVMDLDGPVTRVAAALPAALGQAGPEAAAALAAAMGLASAAECLRRFAKGCRCHVGRVEGVLASYGWISFGEEMADEMALRIRLLPGEAYIWDCATAPDFRR